MRQASDFLLIHHLWLRRFLGILGLLLPFILIFGNWIKVGDSIGLVYGWANVQDSISAYYATQVRDIFVGIMCSVGCFLFAYKGYSERGARPSFCRWLPDVGDNLVTSFAGVFAVGVALFSSSSIHNWVQTIHFISAAAMLIAFSYISLCLFTKSRLDQSTMARGKMLRNRWYIASGLVILASILLLIIYFVLREFTSSVPVWLAELKPVLLLESVAVIAFGISWLVKGKAHRMRLRNLLGS